MITTALRPALGPEAATPLPANRRRAFQGPIPVGDGFILGVDEAEDLLRRSDAAYREVVRPYLIGDDITEDPAQGPRRFVIDFGLRTLEEAAFYPAALEIVRQRVKPFRDQNRRKARRERWWRFGEMAVGMRRALAPLSRYIAANAQGKRILFAWQEPWTCPSKLTNVFAFEDDYAIACSARAFTASGRPSCRACGSTSATRPRAPLRRSPGRTSTRRAEERSATWPRGSSPAARRSALSAGSV